MFEKDTYPSEQIPYDRSIVKDETIFFINKQNPNDGQYLEIPLEWNSNLLVLSHNPAICDSWGKSRLP